MASSTGRVAPPRVLGRLDLSLLGIGAMVGTGIFVLSGQVAAHHAGPAVVVAFVLAGLAALLAAACYADLAAAVGGRGGAYGYCRALLGERVGELVGWALLLEYGLAAASVGAGWSGYAASLLGNLTGLALPQAIAGPALDWDAAAQAVRRAPAWVNLPAAAIILALSALLARGVRASARANAAAVGIKIAVVLAFVALGAPHVRAANWQPLLPPAGGGAGAFGLGGLARAVGLLFFAYNGFDAIATAAGEARRPAADLPAATLAAVLAAMALYVACAAVLVGLVPYRSLAVPHPLSLGMAACRHASLAPILEVGALIGLTSVMLVNLLSQARIACAMAEDGLLPRVLAALHPRRGTPVAATWLAGAACALLGGLLPLAWLGEMMCVGTLLAFVLVSAACLRRRRRQGGSPGRLLLPAASTAVCGLLLATARPVALAGLAGYLGLASGVSALRRRRALRPGA